MVVEVPYKNLAHTLKSLKIQVIDSLPHIEKYIPSDIKNPEELFDYLKDHVVYRKDPKGVELLQTVQTLMDGAYWGEPGHGDCDCFTILTLAACEYLGFKPVFVCLVSNSRMSPSHIYTEVWDNNKKRFCVFDLTNPYYDMERSYKYKQTLPFMILSLQDSNVNTIYNPRTGQTIVLEDRASRRARRAEKKAFRQAKREAKHSRRLSRIRGRQAVIEARNASKIKGYENQGNDSSQYDEPLPDDQQDDQDTDSTDDSQDDGTMSGPIMSVIGGALKGAIQNVTGSAKQAAQGKLNSITSSSKTNMTATQIKQLTQDKQNLQNQLDAAKTREIIFGSGGLIAGVTLGYLIGKK